MGREEAFAPHSPGVEKREARGMPPEEAFERREGEGMELEEELAPREEEGTRLAAEPMSPDSAISPPGGASLCPREVIRVREAVTRRSIQRSGRYRSS